MTTTVRTTPTRTSSTAAGATRPTPSRSRCTWSVAFALSALAVLGVGCGSDDDVDAAACDAAVAFGAASTQGPREPGDTATYAQGSLLPLADALVAGLDGSARDAAATLRAAVADVARNGDPQVLEGPDVVSARDVVGRAVHEGCDARRVDLRALEYRFDGVPDTLRAGRVSFALRNDGAEDHEMVLFRRSGDSAEPLDRLLQLPEEEMGAQLAFTGVAFGGPRSTSHVVVDLEPGTYVLVCFVPQGGTDGPPHFLGGMHDTIVVS